MVFFIYFLLISFYIVQINQLDVQNFTKNSFNNTINKINFQEANMTYKNQSKRNLEEEYEPIRIFIDTKQIEDEITTEDNGKIEYILPYFKEGINRALNIISNIIKVKRLKNGVDLSDINEAAYRKLGFLTGYRNESLFTGKNDYDLIILTKRIAMTELDKFAKPNIIRNDADGRPILGTILFNIIYSLNEDNDIKTEIYTSIFLHEIIHILGFMENQFQYFPNNRNIFIERTIQRPTNIIRKQIIYKSQRILELARGYFGNNINIEGLELGNTTDSEELGNSHWE